MPLIKPLLEQQIFAAFKKLQTTAKDTETAQRELAKDLATAIDSYIKTATIIVPPGQVISGAGGGAVPVVGSTVTPSGPATIA
jgi:hypothetical protein